MRAMLLAAGRGERMRPLTDSHPKPLLAVAGKPLIVWQIERLVRAGFTDLVINISYRGRPDRRCAGDGSRLGATIVYSREAEPMETAGGLARRCRCSATTPSWSRPRTSTPSSIIGVLSHASPMTMAMARCGRGWGWRQRYDPPGPGPESGVSSERRLHAGPRAQPGRVGLQGSPRWTWSGIGVFPISLLREIPSGKKIPLLPFMADWIGRGLVRGEVYRGVWDNLGTPEQLAQLDVRLKMRREDA
jgi:MurNAc alpha-1-phosphate uridylyltransferase